MEPLEEEKIRVLEPKLLEPSKLALNTINCHYEKNFKNKQIVCIIPENKKLIKRKILKRWEAWTEHVNERGDTFYFNPQTKDKVWKRPPVAGDEVDFWWKKKDKKNKNIDEFIENYNSNPQYNNIISPEVIKNFNKKIEVAIPNNDFFLVPYFASACWRKKKLIDVAYTSTPFASLPGNWKSEYFDKEHKDDIPQFREILPDTYMCVNTFYTEYMISLFFSDFYTHGKSIHFVPVEDNSFSTCLTVLDQKETPPEDPPNISINELFVMKRIEGNSLFHMNNPAKRSLPPDKEEYQNACLIQVLHSIAVYQKEEISHNDLHGSNIMIEQILLDTQWEGKELINYDYFQYKLGDNKNLYIPFVPFIIKIIDFGVSCKYSEPPILNIQVMKGETGDDVALISDPQKTHKVVIPPNWFFPAYDVLIFLFSFCLAISPENLLGQQILWVALNFPALQANEPWAMEMAKTITNLPAEYNGEEFYAEYNKWNVQCVTGFNSEQKVNRIQVVLEGNIWTRYKELTSLSLLQTCMTQVPILKNYINKPSEDKKCVILGKEI